MNVAKRPRGSGVPPRCGAAMTFNAAVTRPAPSRRDAAPTGDGQVAGWQISSSMAASPSTSQRRRKSRSDPVGAASRRDAVPR